jgi:hypothetical protein
MNFFCAINIGNMFKIPFIRNMKKESSHLVYGKLDTKFEQLWYHKNRLKICLKLIGSIWCSNLLHIKHLIYYDYYMHNLTIHKYLRAPLT